MRIIEALLSELKRLKFVSDEQFNHEMRTKEELGILVCAAKDELESFAWCSVQASVNASDVENKDRINAVIEKVLGQ
jgi:hypothetical protein